MKKERTDTSVFTTYENTVNGIKFVFRIWVLLDEYNSFREIDERYIAFYPCTTDVNQQEEITDSFNDYCKEHGIVTCYGEAGDDEDEDDETYISIDIDARDAADVKRIKQLYDKWRESWKRKNKTIK